VNKTTKTVTEIEYNESGQVIRETKTVTESDGYTSGGWAHYPSQPWGYGGHSRPRPPFDYTLTLNSRADLANDPTSAGK
jgi:hypothetical protein